MVVAGACAIVAGVGAGVVAAGVGAFATTAVGAIVRVFGSAVGVGVGWLAGAQPATVAASAASSCIALRRRSREVVASSVMWRRA